jgi:hypothetical protein
MTLAALMRSLRLTLFLPEISSSGKDVEPPSMLSPSEA